MVLLIICALSLCWIVCTFVNECLKHKLAVRRQKRYLAAAKRHDIITWDTVITGSPSPKPAPSTPPTGFSGGYIEQL